MLLKRLASLLPDHLSERLTDLDAVGISSTEQLTLVPRQQLRSLPIPSDDLDQLIAHCLLLTGPQAVSGDRLLDQESDRLGRWTGWGVQGLDSLFELEGGGIIEIAGAKRVGRSLLALHAVLRTLIAHPTASCRWIDTEGSFSPIRAKAILERLKIESPESVMDRIIVTPCFNIEPDLFEVIAKVQEECNDESLETRPTMLVIDQISTFFKHTLSSDTPQGHAAMVTIMEEIADLTYTSGLSTIIMNSTSSSLPTNDQSNFSATASKPSLGTAFTYHVDVSLLVQETGKVFGLVDENERERVRAAPGLRAVVEVLKSRTSLAGKWAVFETDGTDLKNVVPPPDEDERTMLMSEGRPVGVARPIHGPLRETVMP